ncbi:PilZ domain protein [Mariprofundus micogutta]|uniref:PilZ domain protein n=1 Tax=Mariprofundus micogutta TaxID=1921010 RepID=A0A1L8CNX3_9PROT|nr:PilZ domain-containing protein [Mariprofundus micogutta]GAV20597.1 PilZ domain protein [Mariprofundus micogutta]
MSYVDPNTVKLISKIAKGLPPDLQEELLLLVASWKTDVRNAPRWHFVEILGFTSEQGTHQGRAKNISVTGIFIQTNCHLKLGGHIHMVLSFIADSKPVSLHGHVVRQTSEGIGVKFDLTLMETHYLEKMILDYHETIR